MAPTDPLVLFGVSVWPESVAAGPPDDLELSLKRGNHLRWAFERSRGFPWYGYYLFRRSFNEDVPPMCAAPLFGATPRLLPEGPWNTQLGTFTSDARVEFVTTSGGPTPIGINLAGRRGLRFDLAGAQTAFRISVTLEFRGDATLTVAAMRDDGEIDFEQVTGVSGDVHSVVLHPQWANALEISGGSAVVRDICVMLRMRDDRARWQPLFDEPLALPVRSPKYPADPRAPDAGDSEFLARNRLTFGAPAPFYSPPFDDLHGALLRLVEDGPAGDPMHEKASRVPAADTEVPSRTRQSLLDLVLFAGVQAPVARMIGLYWYDPVENERAHDYLIVADHEGVGGGDAGQLLNHLQVNGFDRVDASIFYALGSYRTKGVRRPFDTRAYALPSMISFGASHPNNSGLRWTWRRPRSLTPPWSDVVSFRLWRTALGDEDDPAAAGDERSVTGDSPILPNLGATTSATELPDDWPPFPLHFVDQGLRDGWYGYRVTSVDLFGRHSVRGVPAEWHQWASEPDPLPWYYEPPPERVVHRDAVRLLDLSRPPAPTLLEAAALVPKDPLIVVDDAYKDWRDLLDDAERERVVGLRIRWRWGAAQMKQFPNIREFRIYYHPAPLNAFLGNVVRVTGDGATSLVETDIDRDLGEDTLLGSALRIGDDASPIVANAAGTPLRLRVRNLGLTLAAGTASVSKGSAYVTGAGTEWETAAGKWLEIHGQRPRRILEVEDGSLVLAEAWDGPTLHNSLYTIFDRRPWPRNACSVAIPPTISSGAARATNGSPVVKGEGTKWNAALIGMSMWIEGSHRRYRVVAVDDATTLRLHRPFDAETNRDTNAFSVYSITHPQFIDFAEPANWQLRYAVVNYADHVIEETADGRTYEVLLPDATTVDRDGLPLVTSNAVPIAQAFVTVSAVGAKRRAIEGTAGTPMRVFRVHRDPPTPPPGPPREKRLWATAADYHDRSYFAYHWPVVENCRTNVYRAMDKSLFVTDWANLLARDPLTGAPASWFPREEDDGRWTKTLREEVAAKLNALRTFREANDRAGAMAYYAELDEDALRVLAALPENEVAFVLLNVTPLDPDDPRFADARGPNDPETYEPVDGMRMYVDAIDGRARNRYFYRAAYVNRAADAGPLGLPTPPVFLPDILTPRAPVIVSALGAKRAVVLEWAADDASQVDAYDVYRCEHADDAVDLHTMTRIEPPIIGSFRFEETVPGLKTFFYRVVARRNGNASRPSAAVSVRAHDETIPAPPAVTVQWVDDGAGVRRAQVAWEAPHETLLQRRARPFGAWRNIADWRSPAVHSVRDNDSDSTLGYEYRVWSRGANGAIRRGDPVPLPPHVPPQ